MRGIWCGQRITKARCRIPRRIKRKRFAVDQRGPCAFDVAGGDGAPRDGHTGGRWIGLRVGQFHRRLLAWEKFNERGDSIGARIIASGSGGYGVVEYRAYLVDHDGHFVSLEPMVCTDDAEAIKKAQRLVDRFAVELWSGERFVIRLEAKTK
jgi:hypothetical protein